jgi:hypothetical protein
MAASTSFLSKIGTAFKDVFAFLASAKGQAVVTSVEGVAEAVGTALGAGIPIQGAITLINNWGTEIIKTESIAVAAGSQSGTGTQKAAATIAAIAPQAIAFAQANGLSAPTAASLSTINTALTTALNALGSTPATVEPAA